MTVNKTMREEIAHRARQGQGDQGQEQRSDDLMEKETARSIWETEAAGPE